MRVCYVVASASLEFLWLSRHCHVLTDLWKVSLFMKSNHVLSVLKSPLPLVKQLKNHQIHMSSISDQGELQRAVCTFVFSVRLLFRSCSCHWSLFLSGSFLVSQASQVDDIGKIVVENMSFRSDFSSRMHFAGLVRHPSKVGHFEQRFTVC